MEDNTFKITNIYSPNGYSTLPRQPVRTPLLRNTLHVTYTKIGNIAMKAHQIANTPIHADQFVDKLKEIIPKHSPHLTLAQPQPVRKDITDALNKSHDVVSNARTVWPFTLFRDDIIVNRNKVSIIHRDFFWVSETITIGLDDILNVKISKGPFFGSLTIVVRILNSEDHHSINFLWRHDALRIRNILQGSVIAIRNGIDCSHQSKEELAQTLEALGKEDN